MALPVLRHVALKLTTSKKAARKSHSLGESNINIQIKLQTIFISKQNTLEFLQQKNLILTRVNFLFKTR